MMAPKGNKHCCPTLSPDLLSNLPDNIIDDILMRLPLRDTVRTSILSKIWRYNWCRLPHLALDETLWETKCDLTYFTSKFTKIIYHILTLHTGPITKFSLCLPHLGRCPNIDNLITFLSRNDIQHLVLRLPLRSNPYKLPSSLPLRGNPYKLPSSFFTCLQLRHLTLQKCLVIPPPAFKGFDRLISLELCSVTISSKLLESLISRSPLLEQLVLQISGDLSDVIEINAPILRSFTGHIGHIRRSVYFKNIPLLTKLSLTDTGRLIPVDIAKFFESFLALEHLNIFCVFFLAGFLPTRLPFNLNVKHFSISSFSLSLVEEISCALCLIRSFPDLQYLEIKVCGTGCDSPALECLKVEHLSQTFNHLREVKLINMSGTIREVQLMKLLIAKSPVLVRMTLEQVPPYDESKIVAELRNSQCASSNLVIGFV